jgi:ATP-dependent Clp protease protease subunit
MIKVKNMFIDIVAKHTGQKKEKVAQDMERNKWLTPEEAVEYGLVDKIIGK